MKQPCLSIVIPLLNEEENIEALYHELITIIASLTFFKTYEIIFVNDGSNDGSLNVIKTLSMKDHRVKGISFTRNFGHEQATYAGLQYATGDAVVLMDADRQDPPELIVEFEQAYKEGYHIAYGQRVKRLNESWLKKTTSKAFYPIFKFLTKVDLPPNVGDFCLLSRKAVEHFKQLPERALFIRGLIYWSGLAKKAVPFVRRARGAGSSKYNYWKLTIFALENIISFSTMPIYAIIFISFSLITLCLAGSTIALILHLAGKVVMTGWTSLMICMLFLFASTFFFLGILGLYIGKIFQEVKQRPIFLVDEKVNFDTQEAFRPSMHTSDLPLTPPHSHEPKQLDHPMQ
jgi:dolichol-phosphate mannosyltransferase